MMSTQLPPMPARIARLPRDHRGFPVPWFVQWYQDGKACAFGQGTPDFRVADTSKIGRAIRHGHCWVCGEKVGTFKAFVIGPMCAINRTISEPPSHKDCAVFSATACPFLSRPRMKRNEKDLPEERQGAAGFGIRRNPGVACVWITRSYTPFRAPMGNAGILFEIGKPEEVLWFAEGRAATRSEVLASIDSGFPQLEELAIREGADAIRALGEYRARVLPLLPAEAA